MVHSLRWKWHTIDRVVAQYFRVCLNSVSSLAQTYCASTLGVYLTGQSEALTLDWFRRDNVNLTMSWVLSTLNLGIADERCALGVCCFDLFVETNNSGQHTLYLGQWHLVYDLSHLQMETMSWRLVIPLQVANEYWSYQKPYRWIKRSNKDSIKVKLVNSRHHLNWWERLIIFN